MQNLKSASEVEGVATVIKSCESSYQEFSPPAAGYSPVGMYMGFSLLGFGLIVFLLISYFVKIGRDPESLLKTFVVPLMVVIAVFLPLSGIEAEYMTSSIGLLGTVAGYLLGKSRNEDSVASQN